MGDDVMMIVMMTTLHTLDTYTHTHTEPYLIESAIV